MLLIALLNGLCGAFSVPAGVEWLDTGSEATIIAESNVGEAEGLLASADLAEVSVTLFEALGGSLSTEAGDSHYYLARVGVYGAYETQDMVARGARFLFDIDTRGNLFVVSAVMGSSTDVRPVIVLIESPIPLLSMQSQCMATL